MRDPYLVLNVAREAGEAEIRGAYRRLVKRYHPDLNPDDHAAAQRFREIQQAYALLKDKTLRARFDAGEIDAKGEPQFRSVKPDFRHAAAAASTPKQGFQSARSEDAKARNADLFSEFLAGWQRGARRDDDAKRPGMEHLTLSFEEAARGTRKLLTLTSGSKVVVTVPPAVEDGQVLRLKGARDERGKRSEVRVKLSVAPHAELMRDGLNLKLELPVTLGEAVLGGKVRVHTLDGAVVLTIPQGSNTGSVLKLRGKGLCAGASRGDLLVTLKVVLPQEPDPTLKAFVTGWQPDHTYDPRAKS
jgi:DnaJ-class molecular chaperone